jgi:hypothetical protein
VKLHTLVVALMFMSGFFLGLSIKQTGPVPRMQEALMGAFLVVLAAVMAALV